MKIRAEYDQGDIDKLMDMIKEAALEKIEKDFMSEGVEEVERTTKQEIQEMVYDTYEPKRYPDGWRTYRRGDLKKSFEYYDSIRDSNSITFIFQHDINKIHPTGFPQYRHTSWVDERNVASAIPYWIHEGKRHKPRGLPDSWANPKPYMSESIKLMARFRTISKIWR